MAFSLNANSFAAQSHATPSNETDWSNWMASVPDNIPLTKISIAGTHDSGTFTLSNDNPVSLVAKTQSESFVEQLSDGIRLFDIRGRATSDTEIVLHHASVFLHLELNDFLKDARQFLTNHPSETIIMSLKEDYTPMPGVTKTFEDIFRDNYFGDSIFYKGSANNPAVGEVRGKIILLRRYDSKYPSSDTPGYNLTSGSWLDNKTFDVVVNNEISTSIQDEYQDSEKDKSAAIRKLLDRSNQNPGERAAFINYVSLAFNVRSPWGTPYSYASRLNPMTAQYITDNMISRSGWVFMDFVGDKSDPGLSHEIIKLNKF